MAASFDSNVSVTVEAAFGFDPFATPTWTDISTYAHGFEVKRGRSRILDAMQAGTATILLNNQDGRFHPGNTSGAYYPNVRVLTPIRIRATYSAVTYDLFRGFVEAWPQQYSQAGKRAVVSAQCVDGFRLLAMTETSHTEVTQLAGTRIDNLLDTAGWPSGASWRDVDAGNHTVRGITGEFNSVLGEIMRAVQVDNGLFWISGAGVATFRDGDTRIEDEATVSYTFSDDGADHPYVDLVIEYDDTQLWNQATVTRTDGTAQTSSDATSIGDFGTRDLHLSETLHAANGEALALADWMVMEHKDVRARVPAVTFMPQSNVASWPVALGAEFLERVNIEVTPPGASTFDTDFHIEGVTHRVSMLGGRSWVTSFQLSPALPYTDWWILGTAALGTDTRLGY